MCVWVPLIVDIWWCDWWIRKFRPECLSYGEVTWELDKLGKCRLIEPMSDSVWKEGCQVRRTVCMGWWWFSVDGGIVDPFFVRTGWGGRWLNVTRFLHRLSTYTLTEIAWSDAIGCLDFLWCKSLSRVTKYIRWRSPFLYRGKKYNIFGMVRSLKGYNEKRSFRYTVSMEDSKSP